MVHSITLLGSSSGRNAGDAALISGIMDSVDAEAGRRLLYEIPTINRNYIYHNYQNRVRAIGMMPWDLSVKMLGVPTYQSLMRTDLSLIFDAILFDRSLYNPLFNYLSTIRFLLPQAKRKGKLLGCFNVGVGPIKTDAGRSMLRHVCELMDFITVRDESSYNLLREAGIQNPRVMVTADAAIAVRVPPRERVDAILRELGLGEDEEFFAPNVSMYLDTWADKNGADKNGDQKGSIGRERFVEMYAEALNRFIAETGVRIAFVSTYHDDVPLADAIIAKLKSPKPVVHMSNKKYNHYDIKGVLGRAAMLFGMRLHAVILSSSELTPVIALPHQPKVNHYLKSLGLNHYSMGFDDFSAESLFDLMIRGWREKAEIRNVLTQNIPVLRERATRAARLVARLAGGEGVDTAYAAINAEATPLIAAAG